MATRDLIDENWRFSRPTSDQLWLIVALCVGTAVYLSYLSTHSHPAYEGGLYLQIAEEIRTGGYALPERIPYYLDGGIPFAYPPLVFYCIAAVVDLTGVDPVWLELYVPGVVSVCYLIPYYYVAKELLGRSKLAGIATIFFAVTPQVLRWHISAGGIVRSVAVLFTMVGLYAGIKLFREMDRRWVLPAALLFTLTLLSHPVYTVFFAGSYLLLYAYYDRSVRGLLVGALIPLTALIGASPWLLQIAQTHGLEIFMTASGTHTGLFGGFERLRSKLIYPLWGSTIIVPFFVTAFAGGIYAIGKRRYFLPLWMVLSAYVIGKQRFTFVAGSMLAAIIIVEVIAPSIAEIDLELPIPVLTSPQRLFSAVFAFCVVAGAISTGVAFAGSELNTNYHDSATQPQTVDEQDLVASKWIANNTERNETFVVMSDAAEWIPYYAERTVVLSPWGAEWTTTGGYYTEYELFRDLASCRDLDCVTVLLNTADRHPDYLYVSREAYTVHGNEHSGRTQLVGELRTADTYEQVYTNPGVAIFKRTDQESTS